MHIVHIDCIYYIYYIDYIENRARSVPQREKEGRLVHSAAYMYLDICIVMYIVIYIVMYYIYSYVYA